MAAAVNHCGDDETPAPRESGLRSFERPRLTSRFGAKSNFCFKTLLRSRCHQPTRTRVSGVDAGNPACHKHCQHPRLTRAPRGTPVPVHPPIHLGVLPILCFASLLQIARRGLSALVSLRCSQKSSRRPLPKIQARAAKHSCDPLHANRPCTRK